MKPLSGVANNWRQDFPHKLYGPLHYSNEARPLLDGELDEAREVVDTELIHHA